MSKFEQDAMAVSLYDDLESLVDREDEPELLSLIRLWIARNLGD